MTAPTFTEADFVAVTTWSRHRRHWALVDELRPYRYGAGRTGYGLCANSSGATDQEATTDEAKRYGITGARNVTPVADLPGCKFCDMAKARRLAAVTPPSEGTKP